ncbi:MULTISPECIES: hypothetical protein [Haloferax]|uniref:Uncharacterized protein n=2 Tax=Haloferax TaxID=2251 RepID=A0A6G1Z5Y5_9EURY|nr:MULTISPECIES: hypothetical protein [Haloferax]KAB1185330.1 hypothetical protein Hfx1149_14815 [Haloferax sp. CBA1149]MRW81966.1 hypothetical protein [Haloferax marinisediminis]
MATVTTTLLWVIGAVSLLVLAVSSASIALQMRRQTAEVSQQALQRERLRVYHDLMKSIIKLNREAVDLDDEGMLGDAHDRLVLNQESELGTHLDDITETFHRSYYLIDAPVRDAVSEYTDYVSSYHETGIKLGRILSLSGNVVNAMREDLGLSDIFSDASDL